MTKSILYVLVGIFMLTLVDAVSRYECKSCPISDYPVCATNGTNCFLFRDECRLIAKNIKLVRSRVPILQKTEIADCFKKCNQVCTNESAPICASSLCDSEKTFANRCQLDLENCRTANSWVVIYKGECVSPQRDPTTLQSSTPLPPSPASLPAPPPKGDCPSACTREYSPICATLGDFDQTFPNTCQLNVDICASGRKWQIKHDGECIEPEPTCNQNCPKIYSPLCASFDAENRTFTNECLLDVEICVTGNQWDILYRSECTNPPQTCQTMCPEIFEPVCARNNDQLRTFTNQCFLDVEICKTGVEWIVENPGECMEPPRECPQVCPFNYQPVCASFNGVTRTFSNMCLLNVEACNTGESWAFISDGECAESTTPAITISPQTQPPPLSITEPVTENCPAICPDIYAPVCTDFRGSRKTFSNDCEVGVENCRNGYNWVIISKGPCDSPPDVTTADPEPNVCPDIYDPICVMINGESRTFPNKCQLDAEVSRTKEFWELVGPGECVALTTPNLPTGPCPRCTDVYEPVCAFSDGEKKTFTNECQLMGENCYSNRKWVLLYEGECKISDQQRNCSNICPLQYDPVCGTFNGVNRTFPNECELNYESCKSNTQWVFVNVGECDFCPVCSDESDPVCAENNGQTQTFDNSCKMEYENCKTGSKWKIVSKASCYDNQCPKVCPRIYSPVCASNNGECKTFSNKCEMQMDACNTKKQWIVLNEGKCPRPSENCSARCSSRYNPVCAIFQGTAKTFHNDCVLRMEICKTEIDWLFVHPGPCLIQLYEQSLSDGILSIMISDIWRCQ